MKRIHPHVVMPLTSLLVLSYVLSGCGGSDSKPDPAQLTLAATTTTQDSGLLDVLLPAFETESGIKVKVIVVGSGQAMELARRGDVDVLLAHSPDAEKKFMDEGWGESRDAVMHNDFVIVGPADDPAGIRGETSAIAAFRTISARKSPFVSRGDESGTHQKEKSIWKQEKIVPEGEWYIQAGTSMANTLRIADEKRGYTLSDRGTFLAQQDKLDLAVLVEGDERLLNRYSVITVSAEKHPHVQHDAAHRFARFLTSPEGQKLIGSFGVERFGQPLFVPDAHPAR
ncbi:MAG: substrate-binding domain-containing protein [Planctomycetaceae bacterium]